MTEIFYILCNKIWKEIKWPVDWITSICVPIPKKGDVTEMQQQQNLIPSQSLQ